MNDDIELIEPIEVHIEQVDKTKTPYSDGITGRREIVNYVQRNQEIIIDAQVAFGDTDQKPNYTPMGVDEQAKGYMVLLYKDLTDKGVTLKRGDKITKIGQLDVEYYLLHGNGDPAAHVGGQFKLVRLTFADRVPDK